MPTGEEMRERADFASLARRRGRPRARRPHHKGRDILSVPVLPVSGDFDNIRPLHGGHRGDYVAGAPGENEAH